MKNCPICRNDSTIAKNLIFEQIIGNFSAFELAYEGPSEKPELQKWGQGFVSASFSNNGPNEESSVQISLPPNSGTMESVEHAGSNSRIISIFKGIKQTAICFYKFLYVICVIFFTLAISIVAGILLVSCYDLLLKLLAHVGVDIPEELYSQFGSRYLFNTAHL